MAGNLETLKQRKQRLVAESALNRLALEADLKNLRAAPFKALEQASLKNTERKIPWLLPLFSLAKLFALRKEQRVS